MTVYRSKLGDFSEKGQKQTHTGLPAVREKNLFFKVREKSGNSVKSQGKSLEMVKSGKSQGIL